jgi:hypothetical protein
MSQSAVLNTLKGNFAIFYMLAKYVPGDIKYIFTMKEGWCVNDFKGRVLHHTVSI